MENRKLIKFLTPIFVLGFFVANFNSAFAYGIETHAYLTSEVINFYNQHFSNQSISNELKDYLIDGSQREDNIPRWMNHFYDPVKNRGLTYDPAIDPLINLGTWQKSKEWAQNSTNQNNLTYKVPATIASILTAIQQIKISVLTTETDFTWQRAIKFYAQGEKEKAMFILGHILHLTEDKAVSDHTRNDPHPGDSPYEKYTGRFTLNNPDKNLFQRLNNKQPIILNNLNSYFDELAKYSNNNFYSKDTIGIQSGYNIPQPDYETKIDKYFYPVKIDKEFGDYYLFRKSIPDILLSTKFDATLEPDIILDAYWSRLSTKSVQYGTGVINLFFQEVEKAKNDPNFAKTEEKSILAKAFEATKNLFAQIGNFFSGIFGAGQDFQEVGQVTLEQPSDAQPSQAENQYPKSEVQTPPKTDVESPKVNQQNQLQENQLAETEVPQQEENQQATTTLLQTTSTLPQTANFKQCSFQINQSPSRQKVLINEVAWMGTAASANDEWVELKNISGSEIDLTGWQLIDQGEQIKINLGFIYKTKIPAGGFILLERTDDNSVPNITADLIYTGILSNSNEGLRLFDEQCNLIDEVSANPDWPAGDNTTATERKTMERNINDSIWHTSSVVGGTPKRENSQPATTTASGSGGGGETPTNNQQQSPAKILISEVQITDGPGRTENDFIELYNPNNFQVNLNGYRLVKRTETGASDASIKSWTSDVFIPANDYYLWANNGYTGIPATPDITTTATISNDNGVAIRFGAVDTGTIIDSVAWGGAQNAFIEGSVFPTNPGANQSIQRKFQNNTFIDTDNNSSDFELQTCPSPKAQSKNCSAANQAPSAFFVYAPSNPQVGDLITFNAASSSDPDGTISLFQWDFGNGQATTTQATTTYSYLTAGTYTIQLIVFDNQNASSTATSTTISVSPSSTNHLVISEILFDAQGSDEGKEFIELYNPTNSDVNLTDWSLRILISNATSTTSLVRFGSQAEDIVLIKSKSFLLAGFNSYTSTSTQADVVRSTALPNSTSTIYLIDNNNQEIDVLIYGPVQENQSLERRAYQNGVCVSAQGGGEFLGNACDTDNNNDFEIRNTPQPQNSLSFPEPRNAPTTPQNFAVQYSSSTMELTFDWSSSQDYSGATSTITYKITDISNASSTLSTIETASTTAKISINEIGRQYNSSIQALDREGLGSATSTSSSTVPSFFSSLYFYQDSRDNSKNLVEAYYNQYPFVPDLFSQNKWQLLVFYLNGDADKQSYIDNSPWQPNNLANVLAIKYKQCAGGTQANSLIIPLSSDYCGNSGGAYNQTLEFSELEDNHFIVQTASSSQVLNLVSQDYLTIAFYSTGGTQTLDGTAPIFNLVAVDKTKYYFSNSPAHQPPQLTGLINFNFDGQNRLNIDWPKATDPDTLDSLLTYEIQYSGSLTKFSSSTATGTMEYVNPDDNFLISVRAKDDFGNYSTSSLTANWSYPATTFYITQTASSSWNNFGHRDGADNADVSLQSIIPQSDFQFNKVVVRIRRIQDSQHSANLKLSVYNSTSTSSQPNFNSLIAVSTISGISGNPENQDLTFDFSNPVSITNGNKYWLALEVAGYNNNSSDTWQQNAWQNAISGSDSYSGGEAGGTTFNYIVFAYSSSVSIYSNSDWYMKIGLE